ncbi:MAG: curli-like amyloid fiber formation chaperone CsgH [Pseudomonadota bacterium]
MNRHAGHGGRGAQRREGEHANQHASRASRRGALGLLGVWIAAAAGDMLGASRGAAAAEGDATGLMAWIEVERDGEATRFIALAAGGPGKTIAYDLIAEVESGGGSSRTRQGGRATLPLDGGPHVLSQLRLRLQDDVRFQINLDVHGYDQKARATLEGGSGDQMDL